MIGKNYYDVKCPMCGTMNHHLFLDETDGWMICEKCEEQMWVPGFEKKTAIPVYTQKSPSLRREMGICLK